MRALALHITGIVQGVGFRPFVYTLAMEQGLAGWVLNASDGVHCVVEGPDEAVERFPQLLRERAPAMALVERVVVREVEPEGFDSFTIRPSAPRDGAMTLVSPDIATCPACLAELTDPSDRRFGYPFINCTNCGPRFTIIEDIPYDRPNTTMRDFAMCAQCAAEYEDPSNRRFHAQPNACWVCGPRLYLNLPPGAAPHLRTVIADIPESEWSPSVEVSPRPHRDREAEMARGGAIIAAAVELLRAGAIVAIKGLGGFHLACDATKSDAVAELRRRKHRWGKPLAVMVPDLEAARALARVDDTEAALLSGTVRPIVLLRRMPGSASDLRLAPGIADGLAEVGLMLPYTPLHHLLLMAFGGPLVMTSGNVSDEPIATDNSEALRRLARIADAFLLHDRAIRSRYDDSVVRVVDGEVQPVRRARGYAPHPLSLPFTSDVQVIAAGPEQKSTFTLVSGDRAFVSQHIGDLENAEVLEHFERTAALYEHLFRIAPELVAHDLHPEYLSTKWALELDLPKVAVQHHHAHIASVTAEHGVSDPVVGFAFDGTGYGDDGRIWGGEVLIADWRSYERAAHLRYVPMPGGAAAIRRPARMAIGTLIALDLLEHPGASPLRSRLAPNEESTLGTMVARGVNCPLTSSMGRLFDTVAALIGIADDAAYEGEAAILLEAAASHDAHGAYEFAYQQSSDGPAIIDPHPVIEAVLEDVDASAPAGVIAMRFHRAVVDVIVRRGTELAERTGTRHVALGGGVFMNRIVVSGAVKGLAAAGMVPLVHRHLPMNDGAVSFGQAVIAASRYRQG